VVGADYGVDPALDGAKFFGCNFLEMREIETQAGRPDERTLLFDVGSEHISEGFVQQVGGRVVGRRPGTRFPVDHGGEQGGGVGGHPLDDMHRLAVLFQGINYIYALNIFS
jgi:hypothetical protein